MEQDVPRPVVEVHLAHPGAFHNLVDRAEVPGDEVEKVDRVVFDGGLGFAEALEALEVRLKAECHHLERLNEEVAEEEPVGPDMVELLVEFPDLRDGVEFVRIVVPAVHQELEVAHHRGQLLTFRLRARAEGLEKVVELALALLLSAEYEYDGVFPRAAWTS